MDKKSDSLSGTSSAKTVRSRWVPISMNRKLVLDGLQYARRVPLFPVEKSIDLAEVAALRKQAVPRISWAVIFVKAYAMAAQRHPSLRQMYLRWPWAHLVEFSHSTAMVVVDREFRGEHRICWGRFVRPEAKSLQELQHRLDGYQTKPVEVVFKRHVRLSQMPLPLRRFLYWFNLYFGRQRSKRLGTFTMSTLAGQGVLNRGHQTFLTSSLTYGPLDQQGRSVVTMLCDHRVVDGMVAALALGDLETALRGPIADELRSLQAQRSAA